jgi:hypothetical protein
VQTEAQARAVASEHTLPHFPRALLPPSQPPALTADGPRTALDSPSPHAPPFQSRSTSWSCLLWRSCSRPPTDPHGLNSGPAGPPTVPGTRTCFAAVPDAGRRFATMQQVCVLPPLLCCAPHNGCARKGPRMDLAGHECGCNAQAVACRSLLVPAARPCRDAAAYHARLLSICVRLLPICTSRAAAPHRQHTQAAHEDAFQHKACGAPDCVPPCLAAVHWRGPCRCACPPARSTDHCVCSQITSYFRMIG